MLVVGWFGLFVVGLLLYFIGAALSMCWWLFIGLLFNCVG